MIKLKVKSGDTVKVIAGDHKGTTGTITRVYKEKNKAIVEGVNMVSKHTKPSAKKPTRRYREERSANPHL